MADRSGEDRRNWMFGILLLAAISYFWLFNTFISARQDIASSDIPLMSAWTALFLAIEAGLLFLFRRRLRTAFTVLALVNTYVLFMVFSPDLEGMRIRYQLLVLAGISGLYAVVIDILLRRHAARKWMIGSISAVVVMMMGAALWPVLSAPGSGEKIDGLVEVNFADRPNVYFLSFDSMIPSSLSSKFLDLPRPAYIDVLERYDAYIFKNMFSDLVPTKNSLPNVLNIVPEVLSNPDMIVNGNAASRLRQIFEHNGYTTHFAFDIAFFGANKGPFLDYYHINKPYSSCDFLVGRAKHVGFFGICNFLGSYRNGDRPDSPTNYAEFFYTLVDSVAKSKDGPHFYMQHALVPNHTNAVYRSHSKEDHAAYRAYFEQRSQAAADLMERSLRTIRENDPNAIVFLYGDHGTYTSRTVDFEDDPQFFVQDRYGILGAIVNGERCLPYLGLNSEGFQTNARVVFGLVKCLAGGTSPLINVPDFGPIRQLNGDAAFGDYTYE